MYKGRGDDVLDGIAIQVGNDRGGVNGRTDLAHPFDGNISWTCTCMEGLFISSVKEGWGETVSDLFSH